MGLYGFKVQAGVRKLGDTNGQLRVVTQIIMNPEWETVDVKRLDGDIALLKVSTLDFFVHFSSIKWLKLIILKVEPCFKWDHHVNAYNYYPADIKLGDWCEFAGFGFHTEVIMSDTM